MDVKRACTKYDPTSNPNLRTYGSDGVGLEDIYEWRGMLPKPTQEQLDTAWALCLADDAVEQTKQAQIQAAENAVLPHLGALRLLAGDDMVDALLGRAYAITNNANKATIDAIVDRATALAYLNTQTWWTDWMNLPATPTNAQTLTAVKGLIAYNIKREKAWEWVLQAVISQLQ